VADRRAGEHDPLDRRVPAITSNARRRDAAVADQGQRRRSTFRL
jgi:hypothetical protein